MQPSNKSLLLKSRNGFAAVTYANSKNASLFLFCGRPTGTIIRPHKCDSERKFQITIFCQQNIIVKKNHKVYIIDGTIE